MAEQYVHTLIPKPKDFIPSAAQVQQFLSTLAGRGVVPAPLQITIRTPSDNTRSVINPFTQKTMIFETKSHHKLNSLDEIEHAATALADYDIEVTGQGRPKTPPLPISFDEPHHVTVTVRVSSVLRSTSESDGAGVGYGEPCPTSQLSGLFTNPHNGEPIEVPDAGCARFWVEVELGEFLFPEIQNGNLELLNPAIVMAATEGFGIPFVQGIGPND